MLRTKVDQYDMDDVEDSISATFNEKLWELSVRAENELKKERPRSDEESFRHLYFEKIGKILS